MSMFPRVIFNVAQSSVRRGLAEDGTRFQIPFQAAKAFGRLHVDAEFGPRASTVGRSEWLYGIVCGFDVTKQTMLMAELHDESRMNFTRDVLTLNFGLRHEFTENYILIVSMGHELRSPEADRAYRLFRYAVCLLNDINALLKRAFAGRSGSTRRSPPGARAMRCNGSEPGRLPRSACRENRRQWLRAGESK